MLLVKRKCGLQWVKPESRQQVLVLSKTIQVSGSVLSSGGSRAGSTVTASFARLLSLYKRVVMSLLILDASHGSGSRKRASIQALTLLWTTAQISTIRVLLWRQLHDSGSHPSKRLFQLSTVLSGGVVPPFFGDCA